MEREGSGRGGVVEERGEKRWVSYLLGSSSLPGVDVSVLRVTGFQVIVPYSSYPGYELPRFHLSGGSYYRGL